MVSDIPNKADYTQITNDPKQNAKIATNAKGTPRLRCYQILFPLMNMSRSFMYDVPMILSTPLKQTMHITDNQIQWLYSAFYLPAIVFNLFYGALMKKYGAKFTYVALLLMVVGHILFSIGVFSGKYWL